MTRILVTGSRKWRDRATIAAALLEVVGAHPWPITIVHGGQTSHDYKTGEKYGADHLADEIAKEVGLDTDEHLPDWDKYGKPAGPIRNQEMVDVLVAARLLGEEVVCLAFPMGASPGTRGCMAKAEAAGIDVIDKGF